ncbi:MAG: FxsA family protein [Campylobacter sp.]|nr:FxsA family protein [Campylobacter sp.]
MSKSLSLTPLFLLEIVASVLFISAFGLGNFLIFMLLSVIFGVILLVIFWNNMLEFQVRDFKSMLRQFSFVIAGFLLIFPGILTSVLGILVLIFGLFIKIRPAKNKQNLDNEEIIDVEIIEDKK